MVNLSWNEMFVSQLAWSRILDTSTVLAIGLRPTRPRPIRQTPALVDLPTEPIPSERRDPVIGHAQFAGADGRKRARR